MQVQGWFKILFENSTCSESCPKTNPEQREGWSKLFEDSKLDSTENEDLKENLATTKLKQKKQNELLIMVYSLSAELAGQKNFTSGYLRN